MVCVAAAAMEPLSSRTCGVRAEGVDMASASGAGVGVDHIIINSGEAGKLQLGAVAAVPSGWTSGHLQTHALGLHAGARLGMGR